MTRSSFDALRDILASAPDEAGWRALCEVVDGAWEGTERDMILDYAQAHLSSWPDEVRVAPRRWGLDGRDGRLALARRVASRERPLGALVPVASFEEDEAAGRSAWPPTLEFLDARGEAFGVDPRAMRWRRDPRSGRTVECRDGLIRVTAEGGETLVSRRIAAPGSGAVHSLAFAHDPSLLWWMSGFRSGAGSVRLLDAASLETQDVVALGHPIFAVHMDASWPIVALSTGARSASISIVEVSEDRRIDLWPVRLGGADELLPVGVLDGGRAFAAVGRRGELSIWAWPSGRLLSRDVQAVGGHRRPGRVLASGGYAGRRVIAPTWSGPDRSQLAGVAIVDPATGRWVCEADLPNAGVQWAALLGEVLSSQLMLVQEEGWRRAWFFRILPAAE